MDDVNALAALRPMPHGGMRRHPARSPRPSWRARFLAVVAVALCIIGIEIGAFNLPFWSTVAASTDSPAAHNTLGPGLLRRDDGLLEVTDPSRAYLDTVADGTSSYVRIDPVSAHDSPQTDDGRTPSPTSVQVRLDADGVAGRSQSVDIGAPDSLYLHTPPGTSIRLWVQEPIGSVVPIDAVRTNVRVPLRIDWLRVATMAILVTAAAAWRPRSVLWRITLNTGSPRQRALLALAMVPAAALTLVPALWLMASGQSHVFHSEGGYTYDFDQYGHLAEAILHGHTWLDLPVPDELAQASNPYDTAVRDRLLSQGVTPIYWDHALFHGRWYSYFGVLPAILLFAPYRLASSWWVQGGAMLPATSASLLLTFGFLVFGSLLTIRVLSRASHRVCLATACMALALFILGSNSVHLWLNATFYTVPIAASLMLSCWGLWLWLGAVRPTREGTDSAKRRHRHTWSLPGAAPVSMPHLCAGALCIAANFGCRPIFTLVALLGLPLFADQLRAIARELRSRTVAMRHILAPIGAVTLPAMAVVIPLAVYNAVRFGTPLDFGERYQITVTDMTAHRPSLANLPMMIGYYLALPMRMLDRFPWMAVSPTPLPQWGYTEPMVAGLLVLCPSLLIGFAMPALRRRMDSPPMRRFLPCCLALGLAILAFDSAQGGMVWRYVSDFAWLLCLPAIGALPALMGEGRLPRLQRQEQTVRGGGGGGTRSLLAVWGLRLAVWLPRCLMALAVLYTLCVTVLAAFVPGYYGDVMLQIAPGLWHRIRAWFLPWSP